MGLPGDLAEIDAYLDDARFFEPFRPFFDPEIGRPSIPMETYLRMMFLKYRYRLGYEPLCREVADSLAWRRFCRIPLGSAVPHPTTLMKITSRCGERAIDALNQALLAKAHGDKLIRLDKVRADTTVVEANVAYPTDSGLLAKGVAKLAKLTKALKAAGLATRTKARDRTRSVRRRAHAIGAWLRRRNDDAKDEVRQLTAEMAAIAEHAVADARHVAANAARARPTSSSASPPRPGYASTAVCPTAPPGSCRCTIPTPGPSPKDASDARWSSATRPRSSTTPTVSSSTTPWNAATRPTPPASSPPSSGSRPASARRPALSPPTVATARPPSTLASWPWASGAS
jgi:IS5 family transposase